MIYFLQPLLTRGASPPQPWRAREGEPADAGTSAAVARAASRRDRRDLMAGLLAGLPRAWLASWLASWSRLVPFFAWLLECDET